MVSDFSDILEIGGVFSETELDTGVDFTETDDGYAIVTAGSGWGDEPWGDEPWGGEVQVIVISNPITTWTDIETP